MKISLPEQAVANIPEKTIIRLADNVGVVVKSGISEIDSETIATIADDGSGFIKSITHMTLQIQPHKPSKDELIVFIDDFPELEGLTFEDIVNLYIFDENNKKFILR